MRDKHAMPSDNSFGAFVTSKRKLRDVFLRGFAEQLGISPVYMCNNEIQVHSLCM